MNIRHFIWAVAAAAVLPVSCTFREDELFDRASTLRNQDYRENLREILMAPDSGWFFYNYKTDYWPHECGVVMCCTFDSTQVSARVAFPPLPSWLFGHEYQGIQKETGLYSITNQNNVLLSFSTLNDAAHGFDDFEFIIKSVSPEDIVMEGVRHGKTFHMRPATTSPEEMIRNAFLLNREITYRGGGLVSKFVGRDLIGTVGKEKIEIHLLTSGYAYVYWHGAHVNNLKWRASLYLNSQASIVNQSPYAITDKGIELMYDFTVGDVSFSRITLDFPGRKATLCDRFDNEVGALTISDDIQCEFIPDVDIADTYEPGFIPWDPDLYHNQ